MINKKQIESVLKKLIETESIVDQAALQERLREEGILLSQATLSRLIKKLGIVKQAGQYRLLSNEYRPVFKLLSIRANEAGLIIIKTAPGQAQAIAAYFDEMYAKKGHPLQKFFLGSVAGDDTIVVVLFQSQDADVFIKHVSQDFIF